MGNICVIGPKSAGKTTYLAALAFWSEIGKVNIKVTAINDDAEKLKTQARRIIVQGLSLPPTEIDGKSFYDLPSYAFKIEISRLWEKGAIELVVWDYPGEIFDEMESGISNPIHKDFLDESLKKDVEGCLLMLPYWERGSDEFYSNVMEKFIKLMDDHERSKDLRIAVAISKCERGELWPGRLDPEIDIFSVYLKKTRRILRDAIPRKNLQFYAISTFGVLERNDPRPNRTDEEGGNLSVLRDGRKWRPYGMISPLYWLSKGKRMLFSV